MTRKERIEAAVKGEAVDRPPVSFWRRFYLSEQQPEDLALRLLECQGSYDWDFIVVTARTSFHGEAWGNEYVYGEDEETAPAQLTTRIVQPGSFEELDVLDPEDDVLGEHLTGLRWLRRKRQGDAPYLFMMRTPLAIADILVGHTARTLQIMRSNPQSLKKGLEVIAVTMGSFASECIRSGGACGIFLVTPRWASRDAITVDEYNEFGRPYDLILLESVRNAEFNVLQVSGGNCMIKELLDYPAAAFNWDARDPSNPTIKEVFKLTGKAILGGIDQKKTLVSSGPNDVIAEAKEALEATGGRRLLLGPGADYPSNVPPANLKAISDWIKSGAPK